MKKLMLALFFIFLSSSTVHAGLNIKIFGTDDNQHGKKNKHHIKAPGENPPVVNVPEPGTVVLLSIGFAGIVITKIKRKEAIK